MLSLRRLVTVRSVYGSKTCLSRSLHRSSVQLFGKDDDKRRDSDLNLKKPQENNSLFAKVASIFPGSSTQLILGSSVVVALGVSRVFYGLTSSFLALTPAGSLYYGFLGGAITTGVAAGLTYVGERSFRLNPNHAVRSCMQYLSKNKEANEILGGQLRPGQVRSYTAVHSSLSMNHGKPKWVNPVIQMAFIVHGQRSDALVSLYYTKKGLFEEKCQYISLDFYDQKGNLVNICLEGNEKDFDAKNELKHFANTILKKSTY